MSERTIKFAAAGVHVADSTALCDTCNGTGRLGRAACPDCDGSGRVPARGRRRVRR